MARAVRKYHQICRESAFTGTQRTALRDERTNTSQKKRAALWDALRYDWSGTRLGQLQIIDRAALLLGEPLPEEERERIFDAIKTDEEKAWHRLIQGRLMQLMGRQQGIYLPLSGMNAVGSTSPAEVLRFLMEQHDLRQTDVTEIGSQGVVSEILHWQRELNVRQP